MIQDILQYQEVDASLKKIENELLNSEERKKAKSAQTYLKETEEMLKRMDREASALYASFRQISTDYAALEPQIKDFTQDLETSENSDELSYMGKKVSQITEQVNTLDKNMAAVIKKIEELNASFEQIKEKVPRAKKMYLDNRQKFENLKKEKDGEIVVLKEKLTALEKKNNPALLSTYKRLSQENVTNPVVALFDKNRCGGCRMDISMSALHKIETETYILCDNCGRIVYKS